MPETTITALTNASALDGTERVPMDQAGVTVDASALAIAQTLQNATTSVAGKLSAADKTKLDGVATGATANSADATLLARANHTGTQAAGTITGLATVATTGAYADLSGKPTLGTAAATASTDYAPAAQGVTGGDSHDHNGGDGAQIAYSSLSGLPTLATGTNTGDQTIANTSDATSHTVALSASGGSVQLVEGSNITLTTSGTSGAGVVTIASAGGAPGGSDTQIQVNDGGVFGGFIELLWNKITKVFTVKGDVRLDDGGTFTTTIQTVTPTANRVLSNPDATGTYALVAGSSGQLLYNASGANAGLSTVTTDGTNVTLSGRFISSLNGAASAPPGTFTGTWFTGGTSTTTKPQVLIEPTGATSTAWSTSGTGLGVNAASGFAGRLLDLQVNGTSTFNVASSGSISHSGTFTTSNGIGTSINLNSRDGSAVSSITATGANGLTMQSGIFVIGVNGVTGFDRFINFGSTGNAFNTSVLIGRDADGIFAQRNGTNAQTFRVYGTFTDASNFVRAALSSTSTAVTLAAQTAGTGADDIPLNLTAAGTGTIKVNSVAEVVVSSTVAGLPAAPVVGMLTRVTDALAPAVGMTVAGGGAAAALCWYNGSNWSVIGV